MRSENIIFYLFLPVALLCYVIYHKIKDFNRSEIGRIFYLIRRIHVFYGVLLSLFNFALIFGFKYNFHGNNAKETIIRCVGFFVYEILIITFCIEYNFVSYIGTGTMNFTNSVYNFVRWDDMNQWYVHKCYNSNKYSYGYSSNNNEIKRQWLLSSDEKDKVEEILMKYVEEKRI